MHLLRTSPLESKLAAGFVGNKEQARYLLGSFLAFVVPSYLGLLPTSGYSYSTISWLEVWFYVAINVLGITAARQAAGPDDGRNFLTEFTCLYVPIAITTLLAVWTPFWAVALLFHEQLDRWSWSGMQFTENLRSFNTNILGLLTFIAQVSTNAIIYWRITRALRRVQALR